MGAVGAMGDGELRARLKGYINLESTGSTGPATLFESGPGNEALIRAWAAAAPRPHGASFAFEIYKRLPNDTDFTVLRSAGIPGLNFAPVGNSHAYHTSRDTADRVASDTLLQMGETTVATMRAMDALDRQGGNRDLRFASVGDDAVILLADWQGRLLAVIALGLGLVAWVRIVRYLAAGDAIRFVATALWGLLALGAAVGAMVGASALLVASSAVHHPWYASPMRFCALLVAASAPRPVAADPFGLVRPRARALRARAGHRVGAGAAALDRGCRLLRMDGAARLAALGGLAGGRRRGARGRAAGTRRLDAGRLDPGAGGDHAPVLQ